ncbi:hypothetical protein METHB2_350037 [Candidatus Methylobacter favarea]|uniref:Uncharacterized protein n=1 Tax=Candidatus Methylobacter favarea TaxID=2707345 RepID=A0A8S0X1C6_9GAMM|nr:hypothetical protein METHB2_350037 [Candidatus Methylobacter favarea]
MDNLDSKRRFLLASDDESLQSMLDASLEKWRVFLHPLHRAPRSAQKNYKSLFNIFEICLITGA